MESNQRSKETAFKMPSNSKDQTVQIYGNPNVVQQAYSCRDKVAFSGNRKLSVINEGKGTAKDAKAVEASSTNVQLSIIESDALLELQCVYRDGLLLKIMQSLDGLQLEVKSVQSSSINSTFSAEIRAKNLKELDDLRSQLSFTQATTEASTASAQSAQSQCLSMLKELDEKNNSLKGHASKVNKLEQQLDHLQNEFRAKELSQNHLKDEVTIMEKEIMHRVSVAGANKDCELKKIIDEISPKNIENINERLNSKDEEIARLKDEIRFLSAHWKLKTEELESQPEMAGMVEGYNGRKRHV